MPNVIKRYTSVSYKFLQRATRVFVIGSPLLLVLLRLGAYPRVEPGIILNILLGWIVLAGTNFVGYYIN